MYQKTPKRVTMRDRAADEDRPRFVRGNDATPQGLGQPDDIAWAIAEELELFFYRQGISTGKNAAWFFRRGQSALDKSMIRQAYKEHPERFRAGDGKPMTLAQFGRYIVKYFAKNAAWYDCSSPEDVIGMFYDATTLDECTRGLWRVYSDRRKKKGIR